MVTLFGGSQNRATVPGLHLNPLRLLFFHKHGSGALGLTGEPYCRPFQVADLAAYFFVPGRMRWYPAQEDTGVAAVAAKLSNQAAAELEDMKRCLVTVGLKGQNGCFSECFEALKPMTL